MISSNAALAAFAEQAREKPLGMVPCEKCGGLAWEAVHPDMKRRCGWCDTGLVREPCPTCGGPGKVWKDDGRPLRSGDGFDSLDALKWCETCYRPARESSSGLAPRVVEVDLVNWEGEPSDLGPLLKPRCGTCAGSGAVPHGVTIQMGEPIEVDGPCPYCTDGYLDPLCDVLRVRVEDEKKPPRYLATHIAPWCAEVGVALEIRETTKETP